MILLSRHGRRPAVPAIALAAHAFGWWKGLEGISPHDPAIPFLPFPAASIIAAGGHPPAMAALPPRFHPPINPMRVDSEGNLWVQDGRGKDGAPRWSWSVFDPGGRWLGTLEIPVERVMWIGDDFVIGTEFHPELRVQSVEGYRLHRSTGRG